MSKTLQFVDRDDAITSTIESTIDSTRYGTSDAKTTIAGFFERPVKIANYEWVPGQELDELILPWQLWHTNPRVSNRLSNYKNFKGKLHVKVLINGNPFYWGKCFLSYNPKSSNNLYKYEDNIMSIMPALQRPHIWIDPSTSQGGQMALPFFLNSDTIDLTLAHDGRSFGELWLKSLVTLQHAQSVTSGVYISIYAWATEVDLTSPTQTNVDGLSPQSGKDEMQSDGPVSKPAAIVEKLAGKMKMVPIIAQSARATQMAAGDIAATARLFGYSRPRILEPVQFTKIWQTGDLAGTDTKDSVMTLGLTAKTEVTIDPRTVGLGSTDEMAFKNLNAIHSFFAKFEWELEDTPNKPLISIDVTPLTFSLGEQTLPPTATGAALTTTAFTALPFEYWRGEMTYRFQVVGSAYHRGRVLITWDPVVANATPEENILYSKIVDISEERDFSITVGWGDAMPGIQVGDLSPMPVVPPYTIGGLGTPSSRANGVLTMYVLNPLTTSGNNTNPVQMLVSCYSKNMEYWGPNSEHIKELTYIPQLPVPRTPSGRASISKPMLEQQSGTDDAGLDMLPDQANSDTPLAPSGGMNFDENVLSVVCGESIDSFRTAMKRYSHIRRLFATTEVPNEHFVSLRATANSYITQPGRLSQDEGMTMHAYVMHTFALWRGSVRHRYYDRSVGMGAIRYSDPMVTRSGIAKGWTNFFEQVLPYGQDSVYGDAYDTDYSWSGAQVSNTASGRVVTFEQPFYSGNRAKNVGPQGAWIDGDVSHQYSVYGTNFSGETATGVCIVDHYIATGEDYNCFFFLGVPPIWDRNLLTRQRARMAQIV